ncbi:uncharacterized protein PGTG_12264 [Puccinia graminis f. sp. tritici CRL 75-36-700-3]|uniref:Uncharacterized protein n=1 Tax=Puccinia graminis f. sp. tritici (strain CRL 75-36-700-3 / race SCCL) TaxID=418459 RepID=E3KPS3_PUCGT|nr:uncharacterized protein PGTG_12264 [Puccinia graminis f. sp. tritici CRL 75-36-700-3]EFP86308.1 hypothetical protein PGTG_12264 [Puccinia graminis f. sp. tritici CRL 75-36-700-3]
MYAPVIYFTGVVASDDEDFLAIGYLGESLDSMRDDRSASNWVGSFRVGKEAVNGVVCYYTSTSLQLSLGGMVTGGVNRSGIWEVYVVDFQQQQADILLQVSRQKCQM